MNRDLFDSEEEFQFKPLTKGLGFHRDKKPNFKEQPKQNESPRAETLQQFKARGLDLIENQEGSSDLLKSPLPRSPRREEAPLSPTSAAVDEILKNMNKKKFAFSEALKPAEPRPELKPKLAATGISISACFLDAMLVVAGTLLAFIVLLTVGEIDLLANLSNPLESGLYVASFLVFCSVSIIYYLVTRMFLGCSAGEWAYDQQLGRDNDQREFSYGPLIIIRTCINILTGIVLFPLLSSIMGKDLIGHWMGLELYRKL